ncbi:MAG: metallophosphatase family protein [Chitinispirillales bacterium]|nr:metallophosphatase family protein [Chitinispirillales bacterium]
MKYAIVSDIHGNLEALLAVLKDIKRRKADRIVCLGDIVGYYPNPQRCIDLIGEVAVRCVAGNHDYAAIDKTDTRSFTFFAFSAIEWTKQNLTDAGREFLGSLPLIYEEGNAAFVHASPHAPEDFAYVLPDDDASVIKAFGSLKQCVNFIGHTHCPAIICRENGDILVRSGTSTEIKDDNTYLINVGSVGQPRDHDNRACYAIYDTVKKTVAFHRVPYAYKVTQKKIRESKLHAFLAERLEKGR